MNTPCSPSRTMQARRGPGPCQSLRPLAAEIVTVRVPHSNHLPQCAAASQPGRSVTARCHAQVPGAVTAMVSQPSQPDGVTAMVSQQQRDEDVLGVEQLPHVHVAVRQVLLRSVFTFFARCHSSAAMPRCPAMLAAVRAQMPAAPPAAALAAAAAPDVWDSAAHKE
eukprot:CAMPEP_0202883964 /NCGR_PEP_ID=MMETSP1391-20130828/40243_1 /ASSEMBLY_ACC=CAM_ASM_000867 /TAXON_ID=1034604 /ORGANISM="Chlamydomonas leiostraca, Strain SAG 11-49" /LENGTH=165 /DNA_ID=CAMNT_0049567063 /DNA_START=522 /DNA_END=1021 /DNA_ORIENTATION=+